MNLIKRTIVALVSFITFVCIAEPPDTKWTVMGSSTLTITEQVESGTPWIFTLPKAGGRLDRSQKGSSTKLNFRTLVPLLPDGCKITYIKKENFQNNTSIEASISTASIMQNIFTAFIIAFPP